MVKLQKGQKSTTSLLNIGLFAQICCKAYCYDTLKVFFHYFWSLKAPNYFYSMEKSSVNILQNIISCVPKKNESHTGLEKHEGK